MEAASSVGRDSVGQMSAVCELAAEVQELRMAVRKLAGSIMWDRGAAILGKRIPEGIVEQTVDMPAPQIELHHAHSGREPFGKDGRKYFDGEDSKDLIKYPPLTPVQQVHERTVSQPGDQACRDSAARGDATAGPSGSNCAEYGGSPRPCRSSA